MLILNRLYLFYQNNKVTNYGLYKVTKTFLETMVDQVMSTEPFTDEF